MRVRARKAVALVVAIAIVLALLFSLLVVVGDTAAAHAEMSQSVPRPDQVVGGMINRVELAFREPIQVHESNQVVLEYPGGTRIQTTVTVSGRLVTGRFGPLTEPGEYKVIWGLVDEIDGDWTRGEDIPFTYDPSAAPPEWLPETAAEGSGGGISGGTVALMVIVAVAVALTAGLFWPRRGRSPRRQR